MSHPAWQSNLGGSDGDYHTPSPSDSAVGDLESMLKEKDSEIVYLRETMGHNEQVLEEPQFACIRNWAQTSRARFGFLTHKSGQDEKKIINFIVVYSYLAFIRT